MVAQLRLRGRGFCEALVAAWFAVQGGLVPECIAARALLRWRDGKTLPPRNYGATWYDTDLFVKDVADVSLSLFSTEKKLEHSPHASSYLVLFYSHSCPDCRYFRHIWNQLRGATGGVGSLRFAAISDDAYAAKPPFQHFEIPAVFHVSGAEVAKFPMDMLGDYLEKRSSDEEVLAELTNFVRTSEISRKSSVSGGVAAVADEHSSKDHVEGRAGGSRTKSTGEAESRPTTTNSKNNSSIDDSPERLLAILASHPGKELEVLQSSEFRESRVAQWIAQSQKMALNSPNADRTKSSELILHLAAAFYDKRGTSAASEKQKEEQK